MIIFFKDFEEWDDVGLNIPKPAELLPLYREGLRQAGHDSTVASCQTEFPTTDEIKDQQIQNLVCYYSASISLTFSLKLKFTL